MKLSKVWIALICVFGLIGLFIAASVLMIPRQQSYDSYSLPDDVIALDQNWTADLRQQIHYESFGSKLLPYDLFVNLEIAGSTTLLSDNGVMESLGFITQNPAANNPKGLPVGFAEDNSSDGKWVGLTCTSCHTGLVTYKGKKLLIEGGPGMLNFDKFESTVLASLKATKSDATKFESLSKRMALSEPNEQRALRKIIDERITFFSNRLSVNRVDVDYGYGRLDAFGRIFNAVSVTALDMPSNTHMPDAPVSIPMLWGASHLDVVQWNGSAINKNPGPLGQNVTTALAVYGQIDMLGGGTFGYPSSVDIVNLGYIQSKFYKLMSPVWPAEILGALDQDKVGKGRKIYEKNCLSCHELADRSDEKRMLTAKMVDQNVVKTDPVMASNFVSFESFTGPLEGKKQTVLFGDAFGEKARTIDVVLNATIGVLIRQPLESLSAYIAEDREVYSAKVDMKRQAYKARSLNGIWATGPFLHNGSVPTLYDLLQTPANRPAAFYVGSKEMDPAKVGLVSEQVEFSSYFDTALKGNSNSGHEFGTSLNEDEKWFLIEYLKSL